MGRTFKERFERQKSRVDAVEDDDVREVLLAFADALDPDYHHSQLVKPSSGGGVEQTQATNSTGCNYLSRMLALHDRGLDLLEADVETVNTFMRDMVSEPENRRLDCIEYDDTMSKPSATTYQCSLRAFYRFCDAPTASDDRADTGVPWPADDIVMFRERSDPQHDEEDMPEQADLDAMREACIQSRNTRRNRAFLELAAGTGQRLYALVTLKVGDVHLDADIPHVMLNPEIKNDGDKGAIENTGRWKPVVTDTGAIQQWIDNHWLKSADLREEHGAPEDFDDCYLFVGDPGQATSDLSTHWSHGGARGMLKRRKRDTEDIPNVKTVEIPVNPHNWRHYAYTQSQDLPIDESTRRKVFGWGPGSRTGETVYGHKQNEKAGREFAEAWSEALDDGDAESIAQAVTGGAAAADLSPEARRDLITALSEDEEFIDRLLERVELMADS